MSFARQIEQCPPGTEPRAQHEGNTDKIHRGPFACRLVQAIRRDVQRRCEEQAIAWIVVRERDHIRDCERNQDFGETFIALARAVYKTNDRRAQLKREINDLLGSRIVEEKSYASY